MLSSSSNKENDNPKNIDDKKEKEKEKENECCVCLENINDNEIVLPCAHIFHIYCIIKWTIVRLKNNTYQCCPFCKYRYDYKALIITILSELREKIQTKLDDLELIIQNCDLDKYEKMRILKFQNDYNKMIYLFNTNNSDIARLQLLLKFREISLPNDIMDMILLQKMNHKEPLKKNDFTICGFIFCLKCKRGIPFLS